MRVEHQLILKMQFSLAMVTRIIRSIGSRMIEGDKPMKLVLAISVLVGSLSLLVSDWAGQAFPYL